MTRDYNCGPRWALATRRRNDSYSNLGHELKPRPRSQSPLSPNNLTALSTNSHLLDLRELLLISQTLVGQVCLVSFELGEELGESSNQHLGGGHGLEAVVVVWVRVRETLHRDVKFVWGT